MGKMIIWSWVLALVGCSSTLPPRELIDARLTYEAAERGPAPHESPPALGTAKTSLDLAERSYADDAASQTTKDLAYVARRRAELADATARTSIAVRERDEAVLEARRLEQDRSAVAAGGQLQKKDTLGKSEEQLESERSRRAEVDQRAKAAMSDLAKIASVKEESRGMIITLSGAVLFWASEAKLLPAARNKLKDIALALKKGDPGASITIEGHSDATGPRDYNLALSLQRADAVKEVLVARGVAADRIKTVGLGPDQPIADDATVAGRASNRRVEIIVQPATSQAHGDGAKP